MTSEAAAAAPCEALAEYLYDPVVAAVRSWGTGRRDIYGVWLLLHLDEDDPRRPQLGQVGYLSEAHTTDELADSYDSRWSPPCVVLKDMKHLNLCEESGDWYGDPDVPGDPEGRAIRDACFAERGLPAERKPGESSDGYVEAFLDACAIVVRRLHAEGVIERVFGRPVPVGMNFGNDIDHEFGLTQTRDSNPPDLSRGMEEWMMGVTYEQLALQQALIAEADALPPPERARFWTDALIAYRRNLWLKESSPLAERLQAAGIYDVTLMPLVLRVGTPLVPVLLDEAEPRATAAFPPHRSPAEFEASMACRLLGIIADVADGPERRVALGEAEVTRLERLLARLFRESETLTSVGGAVVQAASALHALRPGRYPKPRTLSGPPQNRLLNWRNFGLERSNPLTPEYVADDRAAVEEAYAAFRRGLEESPRP